MNYYLLEHRNPAPEPHFHLMRRQPILAIVVHITAGLEGLAGIRDLSAEKTAQYAASTPRAVSWHSGSDTDGALELLPPTAVAFHCKGYNSSTYGHEISKADSDWRDQSPEWTERTLAAAARHLAQIATDHGVPLRRASRAELDDAVAHYTATGRTRPVGFIGHASLDPARRTDPGVVGARDTFPWVEFFTACITAAAPPVTRPYLPPEALQMELTDKIKIPAAYASNNTDTAVEITVGDALRRMYEWTYLAAHPKPGS